MKKIILMIICVATATAQEYEFNGQLEQSGGDKALDTTLTFEMSEGKIVKMGLALALNEETGPPSGGGDNSGWDDLGTTIVLSDGDKVATNPSTNSLSEYVKSKVGHSSGYHYAEIVLTEQGSGVGWLAVGVVQGSPSQTWLGNNSSMLGAWLGGNLYHNGSIVTSTAGMVEGDVLRVWVRDGQKVWLEYHNGTIGTMIGGGDPETDTDPTLTFSSTGPIYLAANPYGTTSIQAAATIRTTSAEFSHSSGTADSWE